MTIFLAVLAAVATLIALGSYTPIFPFLYKFIPTFDLFQAPARWMIWLVFAFCLMAGFGAEAWHKPGKWGRFWANLSLALGVTVTVIAILAGILVPALPGVFIKAFIIFGVSIVLGCVLVKTNPLPSTENGNRVAIWQWAVVLFVAIDLLVANWGFHQGADPSLYDKATAAAEAVKAQAGSGRIYISAKDLNKLQYEEFFNFRDFRMDGKWDALANAVLPNTNLYGGLASLNNFDPLVPGQFSKLMATVEGVDKSIRLELLRRMGVTMIEVPNGEDGQVRFEPLSRPVRYYWSDCQINAKDADDALAKLVQKISQGMQPAPIIMEGGRIADNLECTQVQPEITILEDEPGILVLHVENQFPGWLVVSDIRHQGASQVWVDNEPWEYEEADYFYFFIGLPDGDHTVRMINKEISIFWFIGYMIGWGITLSSVILTVVLFIASFWKRGFNSRSSV